MRLVAGEVAIYPKEDSSIDLDRIYKATYDSGVSVTEISITATGRIEHDASNRRVFRISNRQAFEILPNEKSDAVQGIDAAEVSVRRVLYRKEPGKGRPKTLGKLRLEILETYYQLFRTRALCAVS